MSQIAAFPKSTPSGLVNLSTKTAAASTNLDFTSLITSTYKDYLIILNDITTADGSTLNMLVSDDNGASWAAANYKSGNWYLLYNNNPVGNQNDTTKFQISTGIDATYGMSGTVWLYGFGYSTYPRIQGDLYVADIYWQKTAGINTTASTVTTPF